MFGLKTIKDFLDDSSIMDPPYSYEFLRTLPEKEYPKYLRKIFKYITREDLNLRNPKTFNEKIQWLKLYDTTPLKSRLTDKVLVRDWVAEKIGKEYLKPVLQICKNFDEIDFSVLPKSFVIKANHGCKWNFIIKDKDAYLNGEKLLDYSKDKMTYWLGQTFTFFAGFELQYEDIQPQIIVEPYLSDDVSVKPQEIEVYCFNGVPKIIQKVVKASTETYSDVCVWDENYNELSNVQLMLGLNNVSVPVDETLKLAVQLSAELAKGFKLVRVDWILYNNKVYFNEMTFTPMSGFGKLDKNLNKKLGSMLNLKK